MQVHVIGSAVLDALCGPIAAFPVPRVQTQVNAEHIDFQPGGGAVNTSLALAQLGIETAIFTRVGADMSGRFLKEELARRGVHVGALELVPGGQTPFTFVAIHPGGDRSFVHTPGVNRTSRIADFDPADLLSCGVLVYQDLFVQPAMDGAPAAELLARARARGVVTVLDECWGLGPKKELLEPCLPHVDFFLPSFDDLLALYPAAAPADMLAKLHGLGAATVVLKMGAQGCILSHRGRQTPLAAQAGAIVDTTGAGDCFDAGFVAALVHGRDPVEAVHVGAAAAAACIAHVGGANGIPPFTALAGAGANPRSDAPPPPGKGPKS
ncbi:MAG: carbohydrate kinase family protein [Planctomycetota bacterium]